MARDHTEIEPWVHGTWEILSYGLTEIGIDQPECDRLVVRYGLAAQPFSRIAGVFWRDFCPSFAPIAFLVLPLMLWMLMPDWGYEKSWLRARIHRWQARPYMLHWLNPFRALGYLSAVLFAARYLWMIRRSLARLADGTGIRPA